MLYRADFHIHSCLSPCGDLEMSPSAIVEAALSKGLNAIALSDHNCGFNLPAFAKVCHGANINALYGAEVTSIEEAHILCLFDNLDRAVEWGEVVYNSLPPIDNQPERFGDQPIVNADNDILGFADRLLISASSFTVSQIVEEVHSRGGLCIPAHIDRSVFGIISQLGFLPDEPFDAVELTARGDLTLAKDFSVLRNSDAHYLPDVGATYTEFDLPALTIENLRGYFKDHKMSR